MTGDPDISLQGSNAKRTTEFFNSIDLLCDIGEDVFGLALLEKQTLVFVADAENIPPARRCEISVRTNWI